MKKQTFLFYFFSILFLLGLITLDVFSLKHHFTQPDNVRTILQKRIGSPCQIQSARFSLNSGLIIEGVEIFSRNGNTRDKIFHARQLRVSFQPVSLLRGVRAPSSITIEDPDFYFEQNESGSWNVSEFIKSLPDAPEGTPQLFQTDITLNGGQLTLKSPFLLEKKASLEIKEVSLDARPIRNGKRMAFIGEGREELFGPVNFQGVWQEEKFDLSLKCDGLVINRNLVRRLAPDVQEAWEKYRVTGPANVEFNLQYEKPALSPGSSFPGNSNLDRKVFQQKIRVHPVGMQGRYEKFEYPLQNIRGTIEFTPERINITGLRANWDGKRIRIGGTADGYGPEDPLHLFISASDVPADQTLLDALDPEVRSFVEKLHVRGTVDVDARVTRKKGEQEPDHVVNIHPNNTKLNFEEFPYPFKNVRGTIVVRKKQITVQNVKAEPDIEIPLPDTTEAELNGQISLKTDDNPASEQDPDTSGENREKAGGEEVSSFSFDLNATAVPLEENLKFALPGDVQTVWNKLNPEGKANVQWEFHKDPDQKEPDHRIRAKFFDTRIQPDNFKSPIKQIKGNLQFRNNEVTFQNITGTWQTGQVSIKEGSLNTNGNRPEEAPFKLKVVGNHLPINEDLKQLVDSHGSSQALNMIQNVGTIDFRGQINRMPGNHSRGELDYYLTVNLTDVALSQQVRVSNINGKVNLQGKRERMDQGEFSPDSPDTNDTGRNDENGNSKNKPSPDYRHVLSGGVDLDGLTANKFPVDSLHCNFMKPTRSHFQFSDVSGRILNGNISDGSLKYNSDTDKFSISLRINDVKMDRFTRQLDVGKKEIKGRAGGHLKNLKGKLGDRKTWKGKGNLWFRDSKLWDIPLFLSIASKFSLEKQKPFNRGSVDFSVKDEKFNVHRMEFYSEDATLLGKGKIHFDGPLYINLKTKFTDSLTIPVISTFLGNLYTFQARGTFQNPKLAIKPLPFLFGDELEKPDETDDNEEDSKKSDESDR